MWTVEIPGRLPSLNQWLSGTHWRKKNAEKQEWQSTFLYAFRQAKLPKPLQWPRIVSITEMTVMPRDVDNCVLGAKYALDALVAGGYLPDDGPEYVPTVTLSWKKAEKKQEKIVILIQ